MKNPLLFRLATAGIALFLASACQKVINLDLKSAEPRLAIEGNLADDGRPCTVLVSRSTSYSSPNTFPAVSGAVITLSDDAGGLETLAETSTPGTYRGRVLTGQPGRRYTLRVETGGEAFVAAATLPPAVPLTGLRVEKSGFGDRLQVVPEFVDPAGVPNSYLFRQYRNGRLNKTLFLQNDDLTDGKANARPLFGRGDDDFDKLVAGDSVRIEMQNIDAGVYAYLRTLSQVLQGGTTAAPANPKSNFSGNVLGYFSAYSVRRRTALVPLL
ncbi:DUF4249 domain-containing protein [Hymenobacter ruricola]|uniref:DUF4249 domain-containing protein n=1 Tax=Hymenobacter ruricola TaxID=2791023 RepID=A0ABS0IBT6_9BACT|nr:DUF4249 domain-containing protein [Hymenobacter ruricola]MBF9224226.1 DUF4249 domain-containing protein [Hymenobacter ruricola]